MIKISSLKILFVFTFVFFTFFSISDGVRSGENRERTSLKSEGSAIDKEKSPTVIACIDCKKIPLVILREFLPDFTNNKKGPRNDPNVRFDLITEYEPDADVAAALVGAKVAGSLSGFEFEPCYTVERGKTPRDVISQLSDEPNVVLLLRVRALTPARFSYDGVAVTTIMADATLFNWQDSKVLLTEGFITADVLEEEHTSDDKVALRHWIYKTSMAFQLEFDMKVLSKMQQIFQKQEISNEIVDLKKLGKFTSLSPSIEELHGGTERIPELIVVFNREDAHAIVYLEDKGLNIRRKWQIDSSQKLNVSVEPGRYTIYFQVCFGKDRHVENLYLSKLDIENKKLYSYKVP